MLILYNFSIHSTHVQLIEGRVVTSVVGVGGDYVDMDNYAILRPLYLAASVSPASLMHNTQWSGRGRQRLQKSDVLAVSFFNTVVSAPLIARV